MQSEDRKMRLVDTHAHYDDEAFAQDRDLLLGSALAEGGVEWVVNVGASMEGAETSAAFAQKYPAKVYAGIGIHPDDVGVFEGKETASGLRFTHPADAMQHLRELCALSGVVCVGEIGLDYHWMVETKETQRRWFREQLSLSHELQLPINVHSRDAAQDTFDLIREHARAGHFTGGIIHCYSGSVEMAQEYVKLGYHIGVGGVVTFKNAKVLKKVVAALPLESLVTETDCPYLAPEPNRGKRNDSRNIRYVIEEIARLKETDPEICAEALYRNACAVYRIG